MKNKKNIALALIAFCTIQMGFGQTDTAKIKKEERRVVIIKRTSDSIPDGRDTIELDFSDQDNCMPDVPMVPQPIISATSMNIGFANLNKTANPNLAAFPELNNGKSFHVGLEQAWGFNLIAHKVRLWTGLRYDIFNYRFSDADVRLAAEQPSFGFHIDSGSNNATKSKVVANYIGIPLAIGYQSNKNFVDEGFSIKAGVNAGYRVRTHSKVKTGNGNKDKVFDDFNLNDFSISPFVSIAYNSIGIYARMSTTPFFKEGQGAEAYAFQFGIVVQ